MLLNNPYITNKPSRNIPLKRKFENSALQSTINKNI